MIEIGTLISSQFISIIITVSLYFLSYLSLIRLLRYWRNWHSPPLSSSLLTTVLALATVVQISFSPSGFSWLSLILASSLITYWFATIITTAVAFKPSAPKPVIHFLAKHSEYSGLWAVPAATVVGYLQPEPKLLGLMVTAVLIELTWFLRCRCSDRKSYPLNAHDLLVLRTQANENIADFAKLHSIRELQISPNGDVSWLGCKKNSLPCPLNFYINRLGLNTPPCCREHFEDLGRFVTDCLTDINATHWIDGGTLLGAVRENGAMLAWDDDIDISVLLDDDMTWDRLCKTLTMRGDKDGYYIDIFKKDRLIVVSYDKPKSWPLRWERNRMRGEIHLDLVSYRHATDLGQPVLERQSHKGSMPVMESGWYGVPIDIILPTSSINFLGSEIPCPRQPESFLKTVYGDFETVELTYINETTANIRANIN